LVAGGVVMVIGGRGQVHGDWTGVVTSLLCCMDRFK